MFCKHGVPIGGHCRACDEKIGAEVERALSTSRRMGSCPSCVENLSTLFYTNKIDFTN